MNDLLREYLVVAIQNLLEEKKLDEFSGAGAVAGMTLPLGMSPTSFESPRRKRKKKNRKSKSSLSK